MAGRKPQNLVSHSCDCGFVGPVEWIAKVICH
ncbi:MAG: hypothetical protein ACI8UD_003165 [Planctomycetota bacterium]|jgi:hypothetical protein